MTALHCAMSRLSCSPTSRLDAEVLLCHVLNVNRSYLHAWGSKPLTPCQHEAFECLIKRRMQGEPIAYLTGKKEFWSLPLFVNATILIPRPETELLVEHSLTRVKTNHPFPIIDLGTGSGAVALAIASEFPSCHIVATDVSIAAVSVAKKNAHQLKLDNVTFVVSDWLQAIRVKAQLIVSNPPYIATADPHLVQGDVRYEPRLALIAGSEGLDCLQLLITQAMGFLAKEGWLLLEHGYNQALSVQALFLQQGYYNVTTYNDLAGQPRITVGQRK